MPQFGALGGNNCFFVSLKELLVMASTTSPIRVGIVGYGNLGRGVEAAVAKNPDMQLTGIYTRRNPSQLQPLNVGTPVHAMDVLLSHKGQVDVLILCGGSKDDLPKQAPELAAHFNLIDSFDTHARIPEHFANVDKAAQGGQCTALISAGWDPGMFSINRVMGEALLPDGATYTFWGKGLSQGHSDAIRRVPGVAGGVQYTIPVPEAVDQVRSGVRPSSRHVKSTGANASWYCRQAPAPTPCAPPSSPCRTTLTSTTPPCTSSVPRNWRATTPQCRTAAS